MLFGNRTQCVTLAIGDDDPDVIRLACSFELSEASSRQVHSRFNGRALLPDRVRYRHMIEYVEKELVGHGQPSGSRELVPAPLLAKARAHEASAAVPRNNGSLFGSGSG